MGISLFCTQYAKPMIGVGIVGISAGIALSSTILLVTSVALAIFGLKGLFFPSPQRAVALSPEETALRSVTTNGMTLRNITNQTSKIALAAVQQNGLALQFVKNQTVEIAIAALSNNSNAYHHLNAALKASKQVLQAAVQRNGLILEHIPHENQTATIVDAALKSNPRAWQYVADRFKILDKKKTAIESVQIDGMVLEHLGPILQKDKEVVEAAIRQDGLAIMFAPDFQNDDEMGQRAVTENAIAFQRLSDRLRDNEHIALIACKKNPQVARFISDRLKRDPNFLKSLANHSNPLVLGQLIPNFVNIINTQS